MNPLEDFLPEEPCWCSSGRMYQVCHGGIRPRSEPGEPVPDDDEATAWLAPHTGITWDALLGPVRGGAPIRVPTGVPEVRPVYVSEIAAKLAAVELPVGALTLRDLGRARFEAFQHVGLHLQRDQAQVPRSQLDDLRYAVIDVAAVTLQALRAATRATERPTLLCTDSGDPGRLVGQTMFWADHVLVPDLAFDAVVTDRSPAALMDALSEQRRLQPLIEADVIVPVASDALLTLAAQASVKATRADLSREDLVAWVRDQLMWEGPTGREALFVTARDDLELWPKFWLHAYIDPNSLDPATGQFETQMLSDYDPNYDYRPWITQTRDDAIAWYVQRINEQVATAELLGGTYLTRSPFRARLLARKGSSGGAAKAALWADVPLLPDADPATLAQAASEDEAVEALRRRMRRAVRSSATLAQQVDQVGSLAEELQDAARALEGRLRSARRWAAISTAVGVGTVALGGIHGVVPFLAAAGLGAMKDLLPYFQQRSDLRADAAWLFYLAHRRGQRQLA